MLETEVRVVREGFETKEKEAWYASVIKRFRNVLKASIGMNKGYNILNGKPARNLGEMKIFTINKGSGLYVGISTDEIIRSYMPDGTCGYHVLQVNFGPEEHQIHITDYYNSYLTLVIKEEAEITGALQLVANKVKYFRMFKDQ